MKDLKTVPKKIQIPKATEIKRAVDKLMLGAQNKRGIKIFQMEYTNREKTIATRNKIVSPARIMMKKVIIFDIIHHTL
jgi:hypothetical protein